MQQATSTTSNAPDFSRCLEECLECFKTCTSCFAHCVSLGEKHVEATHLTLMAECARLCEASVALMGLKSRFAYELCQVCAQACEACADSCETVDEDDRMMRHCADVCRSCARACREMAH